MIIPAAAIRWQNCVQRGSRLLHGALSPTVGRRLSDRRRGQGSAIQLASVDEPLRFLRCQQPTAASERNYKNVACCPNITLATTAMCYLSTQRTWVRNLAWWGDGNAGTFWRQR